MFGFASCELLKDNIYGADWQERNHELDLYIPIGESWGMANTFLLGLINATYMHDLKSLVYNHKEQVLLNFKHLLKKYIPPGTNGLEKKMAAFAITLAISGNCELY